MSTPDPASALSRRHVLALGGGLAGGLVAAAASPLAGTAVAAPRYQQRGTLRSKVTVIVPRTDTIVIDGVRVSAEANVSTNVEFLPLSADGTRAAAAPDFSMTAGEVDPVVRVMRGQGWDIGCLYNQETAEAPQLYFSHQFATGDPYTLARQIRLGLDRTRAA